MKKKNKKIRYRGFTLTEVMTSLVIMVILVTIASGVIITTFNIFARNAVFRAAQNEGNNVYNLLYDHISYSSALKIAKNDDINYMENNEVFGFDDILSAENKEFVYSNENVTPKAISKDSIKPYYEVIEIRPQSEKGIVKLKRKTVDEAVLIFGESVKQEDESVKIVSPYNFICEVQIKKYNDGDKYIKLTVRIKRDGEVFYEREGCIPLLNKDVNVRYTGSGITSNEDGTIKILYTYLQ